MRKLSVARLVFVLPLITAAGIWVACGDDDAATIPPANDAGSLQPHDSGGGSVVDTGTGSPPHDSGAPADGGLEAEAPVVWDAGETVTFDSGLGGDAGALVCFVGSEVEVEPNDTKEQANVLHFLDGGFHPGRCGLATVPDGGLADAGEDDWLTFQLSQEDAGYVRFFVYYEGQVTATVETDGMAPVDITQPNAALIRKLGQDYYVRVHSKTDNTESWRIVLFECKNGTGTCMP